MEVKHAVHLLRQLVIKSGQQRHHEALQTLEALELAQLSHNKPSMLCCYFGVGCDCSYSQLGISKCSESPCVFTATQHTLA